MAAVYFNLYLSSMQKENKEKSIEYTQKCLEYHILAKGDDKNISCANCYFILSQLELKSSQMDRAIEYMNKSLAVFDLPDLT